MILPIRLVTIMASMIPELFLNKCANRKIDEKYSIISANVNDIVNFIFPDPFMKFEKG